MIDLYILVILNGWKVLVVFEEMGFEYIVYVVNLMKGE